MATTQNETARRLRGEARLRLSYAERADLLRGLRADLLDERGTEESFLAALEDELREDALSETVALAAAEEEVAEERERRFAEHLANQARLRKGGLGA